MAPPIQPPTASGGTTGDPPSGVVAMIVVARHCRAQAARDDEYCAAIAAPSVLFIGLLAQLTWDQRPSLDFRSRRYRPGWSDASLAIGGRGARMGAIAMIFDGRLSTALAAPVAKS